MKDVGGAVLAGSSPPFLDDDDVYYYIRWRLKLEGETENMGVCTKERKGVTAAVLMATPCTNSLGGESGGHLSCLRVVKVLGNLKSCQLDLETSHIIQAYIQELKY